MTLPIDRTALAAAVTNQVPNAVIQSAKNIAALTVPYDTIDELNVKVNLHASTAILPHPSGSVTTDKIADLGVTTAKIAELAVTNGKIANATLTADKFVAGVLDNETANGLLIAALTADTTLQKKQMNNRVIKDLSTLLQTHGKNVVITGDSLSYNRYDFDATSRLEAYDCKPGMQSWSFMLRDAIHRNDPYWTNFDETIWGITSSTVTFGNFGTYYGLFNNRGIAPNLEGNTDEFRIYVKHKSDYTNVILYMQKLPTDTACSFDIYVDSVLVTSTHDNNGLGGDYLGYDPDNIIVPVAADNLWHEIKLTNFLQTASVPDAGGGMEFVFYGWGTKLTNVYLTGSGGKTASVFNESVTARVLDKLPDVLFFIIGANDGIAGGTDITVFKAAVQHTIDVTLLTVPTCEIVLLSCTDAHNPADPAESTATYVPRSVREPYANALRDLAAENDCCYIDVFNLFNNVAVSEWRYDNVHMTKLGNTILAREIESKLIPQSLHDKKMLAANLRYGMFGSTAAYKKNMRYSGEIYFTWNGSAFVIETATSSTDADNFIPVSSIVKTSDYTITVNLKTFLNLTTGSNYQKGSFSPKVMTQFGGLSGVGASVLHCKFTNLLSGSFDVFLIKPDGTVADAAIWTNNTNLKFYLAF